MNLGNLPKNLSQRLEDIRISGQYRSLRFPSGGADFVSNDYLSLTANPFASASGSAAGSGGSRLLAGNHPDHIELETICATWLQSESCLLFPSGYTANLGLFSSIGQRHDTFILDEQVHASIKDGVRLSLANHHSFRHQDLTSLKKKLETPCVGNRFVVVESIYSMSGDVAPLREMLSLCRQAGAYLIVDEAHSTGILGPKGAGLAVEQQIQDQILARIHCFGKAVGRSGAVVAGSCALMELMVNTSRPFIYSTAPSPLMAHDLANQIGIVCQAEDLRSQLQVNIRYIRERLGLPDTSSPILYVTYGSASLAKEMASRLQNQGFDIRPILSPTVKAGQEGIRVIIHAQHQKEVLDALANQLAV